LPVIAVFHALGFFWMYGRFCDGEVLLLISWLGALLLYVSALLLFDAVQKNRLRGAKVTLLSLLLSMISGYAGAVLAFNTYGT
jgi:hypothetical protein